MRSGMRTLSSKERVLPHTPSPKEQRAFAVCEQLIAERLLYCASTIAVRKTLIHKEKQCVHFVGRIFLQYKFLQPPRHNPSLDAPHTMCRRLSSSTCAHNARAMSVAARVGFIATAQTAQSNQSARELFAGMISRSTPQTILSAD